MSSDYPTFDGGFARKKRNQVHKMQKTYGNGTSREGESISKSSSSEPSSSSSQNDVDLDEIPDRDELVIGTTEGKVSEEDMKRLKKETAHISFSTILHILHDNDYDVEKTINMAKDLLEPETLSKSQKALFASSWQLMKERGNKNQPEHFRKLLWMRDMCPQEDQKILVDYYYKTKRRSNLKDSERFQTQI
ncbi:unnamed protein product [Caenorhabditis bovis]|uniref:ELM2 domain-containing protein n=1 Tax=Caenorhabditis bovis TaxID=2654633 RepID=A0A8S1F6E1_9PELO|nr:unnamed protein product [Caenorhabditis bovis]